MAGTLGMRPGTVVKYSNFLKEIRTLCITDSQVIVHALSKQYGLTTVSTKMLMDMGILEQRPEVLRYYFKDKRDTMVIGREIAHKMLLYTKRSKTKSQLKMERKAALLLPEPQQEPVSCQLEIAQPIIIEQVAYYMSPLERDLMRLVLEHTTKEDLIPFATRMRDRI